MAMHSYYLIPVSHSISLSLLSCNAPYIRFLFYALQRAFDAHSSFFDRLVGRSVGRLTLFRSRRHRERVKETHDFNDTIFHSRSLSLLVLTNAYEKNIFFFFFYFFLFFSHHSLKSSFRIAAVCRFILFSLCTRTQKPLSSVCHALLLDALLYEKKNKENNTNTTLTIFSSSSFYLI